MSREVLIKQTCRTGLQTVEREDGRYFVTIRNRTYSSEVEVPIETARRYYRAMKGERKVRTYRWGNNPRRAELKGRHCVVEARDEATRSVKLHFLDTDERVISSYRSLG